MKYYITIALFLFFNSIALSAPTITFTAPTENVDNTPLTDLYRFIIQVTKDEQTFLTVETEKTSHTFQNLPEGTYSLVVYAPQSTLGSLP